MVCDMPPALSPTRMRSDCTTPIRADFLRNIRCDVIIFQRFAFPVDTGAAERKPHRMKLNKELLASLPKVLLHEHLDGVLRPQTIIDLARDAKYAGLPTSDPRKLSEWFLRGANQGSLTKYLEGFTHTIAVMQTEDALQRVAYEQAEDLSRDGIVYFETRFAPVFHTQKGLTHQQIVSAVLKG